MCSQSEGHLCAETELLSHQSPHSSLAPPHRGVFHSLLKSVPVTSQPSSVTDLYLWSLRSPSKALSSCGSSMQKDLEFHSPHPYFED